VRNALGSGVPVGSPTEFFSNGTTATTQAIGFGRVVTSRFIELLESRETQNTTP
jgi:hypothetical protein